MNQYASLKSGAPVGGIVCDLRSDTVTRPCLDMRKAMADAEVGDDVYGEDPNVNRLEARVAHLLGKEAGLLLPSGTQSNLCAIMAHCGRGEEVIVGNRYHVFIDEAAGASVLAGVALFPVALRGDGSLSPQSVAAAVKDDDPHCPVSKLLSLENTVHGKAIPLQVMQEVADAARANGLNIHLDGARFFNAVTAIGCEPKELARISDSVSVCLSKGLGAPLGSVLVGSRDLIARARRHRKILGGGMRQAGIFAAAGLFALDRNIERLADDHDRAARLAAGLKALGCGEVTSETNMVFFTPEQRDHVPLHEHLERQGVRIGRQYPTIRMVLHKDVNDEALETCLGAFQKYFEQ